MITIILMTCSVICVCISLKLLIESNKLVKQSEELLRKAYDN